MARRIVNRHELRAAAEAAEARGLNKITEKTERASKPKEPSDRTPPVKAGMRMKVVWAVCDVGGRTVATFEYAQKAEAEALTVALKAKGKGMHFVRSLKEPINPRD